MGCEKDVDEAERQAVRPILAGLSHAWSNFLVSILHV